MLRGISEYNEKDNTLILTGSVLTCPWLNIRALKNKEFKEAVVENLPDDTIDQDDGRKMKIGLVKENHGVFAVFVTTTIIQIKRNLSEYQCAISGKACTRRGTKMLHILFCILI